MGTLEVLVHQVCFQNKKFFSFKLSALTSLQYHSKMEVPLRRVKKANFEGPTPAQSKAREGRIYYACRLGTLKSSSESLEWIRYGHYHVSK